MAKEYFMEWPPETALDTDKEKTDTEYVEKTVTLNDKGPNETHC